MDNKFKVGDKVVNFIKGQEMEVIRAGTAGNRDVQCQYFKDGQYFQFRCCGDGREYSADRFPVVWLESEVGDIELIKSMLQPPKKSWEELKAELESCEKEWECSKENYYLVINYENDEAFCNYSTFIRREGKYYEKQVVTIVSEINDLNYFKEFEAWLFSKEEPKEDYPILTGLEEVGTVGYMRGAVCKVMDGNSMRHCRECVQMSSKGCSVSPNYPCRSSARKDKNHVYYKKTT